MNFWLKIGLAFAAVWAVAGGAIFLARSAQPTSESVTKYVHNANLGAKSGPQRAKTVQAVADMYNRITMEDRERLRRAGVSDQFYRALTPEEQTAFLDATLPSGFKQLMESFNKMAPERRKRMVDKALAEMRSREGEQRPALDDQNAQRIVEQGLRSFYSDASADAKLDLAPFIEQLQKNLQGQ